MRPLAILARMRKTSERNEHIIDRAFELLRVTESREELKKKIGGEFKLAPSTIEDIFKKKYFRTYFRSTGRKINYAKVFTRITRCKNCDFRFFYKAVRCPACEANI